jgi:hypothetical protein
MSLPVCPSCGSSRVSPDGSLDRCDACGYSGPVAGFHAAPRDPRTIPPRRGFKPTINPPHPMDKALAKRFPELKVDRDHLWYLQD